MSEDIIQTELALESAEKEIESLRSSVDAMSEANHALKARIAELEAALKRDNDLYDTNLDQALDERDSLLEENRRYREALEFYADSDNYVWDENAEKLATAYVGKQIEFRAKEALKEKEERAK